MSRMRIALPILLSSISIPTLVQSTEYCAYANWHTPQCEAQRTASFERARNAEIEASIARVATERARAFAVARNIEINRSVARVEAERARQLALSLTHCKTPASTTPRCLAERNRQMALNAERARKFAAARNAEIEASMARVKAERERAFAAARNAEINASIARVEDRRASELALSLTHCKTSDSTTPRCLAERAREFANARNAEATASIERVQEARRFEAARNAEIEASMARVATVRQRELASNLTHCKTPNSTTPRCLAERKHQVALNLTHCKTSGSTTPRCLAERAREFAAARNAEIEASMARVAKVQAFARARNAEVERSMAAAKAERTRKFEIARNAEIKASLKRVEAARDRGDIVAYYDMPLLETGAINMYDDPSRVVAKPSTRTATAMKPCYEARYLESPLHFSNASSVLDYAMMDQLDRLVVIAKTCPAISIEVHGHSDAAGPVQVNRNLAERRARAAVNYLVEAGVARKRLTAIGHGSMDPIMPNTNETNRAINRRVEINIQDPISDVAQQIMGDLAELLDPTYRPQLARLTP